METILSEEEISREMNIPRFQVRAIREPLCDWEVGGRRLSKYWAVLWKRCVCH
jgi:hypothetical protein